MLGKNKIKLIKSLEYKKYRLEENLFLAEGNKLVTDILESGFEVEILIGTSDFLSGVNTSRLNIREIEEATGEEISRASLLKHPQQCLALCKIPVFILPEGAAEENLLLCLDDIQDPGNLGTILRLASWFGISNIVCSPATADIYNPRAVQASMGAICHVRVHYTMLEQFLTENIKTGTEIFGTFLEGENIYTASLPATGIVVLGNEGNGISAPLLQYIGRKLMIPAFAGGQSNPESLNVSVAAAIIISEFRRRTR